MDHELLSARIDSKEKKAETITIINGVTQATKKFTNKEADDDGDEEENNQEQQIEVEYI